MLAAITSYWKRIPALTGVEVCIGDGDTLSINTALVKRTKSRVRFISGEYDRTSYQSLTTVVPSDMPVAITISGKGIIHRSLPAGDVGDNVLKLVLPNARAEDFYVQKTEWGGAVWVSVARRDLVDKVVGHVEQQGPLVVCVALGPMAVFQFSDYLIDGIATDTLRVGRHRFEVQEGKWLGYELLSPEQHRQGRPMDIGGEQFNEKLLPAFALAFTVLADTTWPCLPISRIVTQATDYRERSAFRRSATVLIAFFLTLLVVNALYFMHYTNKVTALDGSDALSIQRALERLEQEAAEREDLLRGLWDTEKPAWNMAFLADRIAASRPDGIRFERLEIYPRDEEESRKQRRPIHIPKAVRIEGTCMDMQVLNMWVEQLRTLHFCQQVTIGSYGYDEQNETGVFVLSLTMK